MEVFETTFLEAYANPGWTPWLNEYIEECGNENIAQAQAQVERYKKLAQAGTLKCIGVFDGELMVGLAMMTVNPTQHYDFPLIGVDAIYLRKPWRQGVTGLRLLRAMKALTIREGAPGFSVMAPPDSKLDHLCERLGFYQTHKAYWCQA